MSVTSASNLPRWQSAGLWIIRGLLALAFLAAGGAKLYGVPMLIEEFERIGFGQWFRYFTGVLEILGAGLLLLPGETVLGAALLICIMVGATLTHLFVIGGSPVPALVLLTLAAIVAMAERRQVTSLFERR